MDSDFDSRKKESIENFRHMWRCIAYMTLLQGKKASKNDYFVKLLNIPRIQIPFNSCYLCEFAVNSSHVCNTAYCELCPIDWTSTGSKYCGKIYNDWICESDILKSYRLAKQISIMPEKQN